MELCLIKLFSECFFLNSLNCSNSTCEPQQSDFFIFVINVDIAIIIGVTNAEMAVKIKFVNINDVAKSIYIIYRNLKILCKIEGSWQN